MKVLPRPDALSISTDPRCAWTIDFDELLEIRDLRDAFQPSLDSTIKWSKSFFKNREGMEKVVLEDLEDEE